jgi:hypothetical protein
MYLALEAFLEVASGAGDPMNCSTLQGSRVDLLFVVKIKPYLELLLDVNCKNSRQRKSLLCDCDCGVCDNHCLLW